MGRDRQGASSFGEFFGKPKTEPEEGRGWEIEEEGGPSGEWDEAKLAGLPDPTADVRARVGERPRADGPMTRGPACYQDEESDELELLRSFRVRTTFPEDVRAEVRGLPPDPSPSEYEGREDLREALIYTIDGDDAKDHDDAISIRTLDGGAVEIGVHIADVSHYVVPGTALDEEALSRGTSVYLPDQVVPMLPEALSNGLCSLVEGRDRLAYSVHMTFDAAGHRTDYRAGKSVVHSKRRCTYAEVQGLLDGRPVPEGLEPMRASLEAFAHWTRKQQGLRDAKGSLRMQSKEQKFLFDESGEVREIVDAAKTFSMTLIEETALAANQAVGDFFRDRGLPTIYRVHPEKDPEEIAAVAEMLLEFGIRVPDKERLTGRDVGRLIRQARRKPNAEALIARIMGLVERAVYEVKDHQDVAKHFGLAREAYLHFTSPIRRYPDLLVHRWLHQAQSQEEATRDSLGTEGLLHELNQVAGHASLQSETAEMCERAVKDLKICQFMEPHIGEKIDAKVIRVSRAGLDVHLPAFNVRGFLPSRSIGQRPVVEGPILKVRVGKNVKSFTEGYAIAVRVKDVDFIRLQVLLELN